MRLDIKKKSSENWNYDAWACMLHWHLFLGRVQKACFFHDLKKACISRLEISSEVASTSFEILSKYLSPQIFLPALFILCCNFFLRNYCSLFHFCLLLGKIIFQTLLVDLNSNLCMMDLSHQMRKLMKKRGQISTKVKHLMVDILTR